MQQALIIMVIILKAMLKFLDYDDNESDVSVVFEDNSIMEEKRAKSPKILGLGGKNLRQLRLNKIG